MIMISRETFFQIMAHVHVAKLRDMAASVVRPITLRDVRRALSHKRPEGSSARAIVLLAEAALADFSGQHLHRGRGWMSPNAVDRLISIHGASYELDRLIDKALSDDAAERIAAALEDNQEFELDYFSMLKVPERLPAERTDHHAETDRVVDEVVGVEDADAHGGDGNSAECDHRASTAADDRSGSESAFSNEGAAGDTPDSPCTGDGSAAEDFGAAEGQQGATPDAATREDAGLPTGWGESGGDELTAGMGAQQDMHRSSADESAVGNGVSAAGTGGEHVLNDLDEPQSDAKEAESLASHFSSDTDYLSDEDFRLKIKEQQAARRAARLLHRLIADVLGTNGDPSPRVDPKALVREMVSRRYSLDRVYRRESEKQDLLILVDDSISCHEVIGAFYGTALEVARNFGRVSVLVHSNGFMVREGFFIQPWLSKIISKHAEGLHESYYSNKQRTASEAVWNEVAKRNLGLILALGDHDADWALDILQKKNKVIAIHHNGIAERFSMPNVQRIGSVKDAISAAESLEQHFLKRRK